MTELKIAGQTLAERFRGRIWKIETDPLDSIIAIETRAAEDRTAQFSAYNYRSGKCLFKEVSVQNGWSWSLRSVYQDTILLHSYLHEKSPEHCGIIALNTQGVIKWQHHNLTLGEVNEGGLLAYNPKIQPRMLQLISVQDGSLRNKELKGSQVHSEIRLPAIAALPEHLKRLVPADVQEPVFYLSFADKEIIAYHRKQANLFSVELLVFHQDKLLYLDKLEDAIQKLLPEAFFMQQNHLFYMRNKAHEIVSYLV